MKKLYLAWLICLMAFQVSAQQRWVTGVVADTNGVPVVGATVTVKGGTNGAITNSDGSFRIKRRIRTSSCSSTSGTTNRRSRSVPAHASKSNSANRHTSSMTWS